MKLVVFACVIAFANAGFTWDSRGTKLDRLSTLKLSVAGPLTAGSKATVTASGTTNLHVPLTSGAWQVRVYEDGVPKETHTDVGDLLSALKFDDAKNTTFSLIVSFTLPKKQASGKFNANLVATDQAKSDYLCLDIKYAYSAVEELADAAPAPFCMHQEDTVDHKCFEACAPTKFAMKGIHGASHCPSGYNTVDKTQVILQCPDGVTSLRYCPDTALNVTVETKGEEHPTTLGSAVQPIQSGERTIVQLVSSDPELSTLVAALKAAQLTDTLSGGSFTVFAPTNKAFSLLPSAVLAHLLAPANIKELQTLLEYHVLSRAIQSKELLPNTKQQQTQQGIRHNTLEGRPLIFQDAGVLLVNDAVATFVDLEASNGVVHVIDQVLLPTFTSDRNLMEVVASYPQLSTFTTALKAGAFTNLGQILAGNDVLQRFQPVWDGFLNQCAYGRRGKSIFHVPSRSAQCPYTVFAPTNEAFAKLPKATLERLLDPKNIGELQDILELHIVAGDAFEVQRIRATGAFTNEKSLPGFVSSLNSQLNSDTTGEAFFIDQGVANGTTLLSAGVFYESNNRPKQISSIILGNLANLGASNGIVHIIDSVLIPLAPTKTIVESLAGDAINRGATFLAALKAGLLERTLNDTATGPYTVFVPTNEAFAKLPKATLKHLLDPRNIGELQDLLEYHIVAGHDLRVGCVNQVRTCDPSRDLESFKGATLMGQKVEVTLVGEAGIDGVIMIDKSNVIAFENSAFDGTGQSNHRSSNGNRILIDQVLTKYYMPTLVRTL